MKLMLLEYTGIINVDCTTFFMEKCKHPSDPIITLLGQNIVQKVRNQEGIHVEWVRPRELDEPLIVRVKGGDPEMVAAMICAEPEVDKVSIDPEATIRHRALYATRQY